MIDKIEFGDVVTIIDSEDEICFLSNTPDDGKFSSSDDFIGYNVTTSKLCTFNRSEISEIAYRIDYNPSSPIFAGSLLMGTRVLLEEGRKLHGKIIAVNPILIPYSFDFKYLIQSLDGSVFEKDRGGIELV